MCDMAQMSLGSDMTHERMNKTLDCRPVHLV